MEVGMAYIKVRDRKLLYLFDFYMEYSFAARPGLPHGCPFYETEFDDTRSRCEDCCGKFFDTGSLCPCSVFGSRAAYELRKLLIKEGFIPK
jgi:hypothetical protein